MSPIYVNDKLVEDPSLPPNLKQTTHPALRQYHFTCILKNLNFYPDFPEESCLPPASHPNRSPHWAIVDLYGT